LNGTPRGNIWCQYLNGTPRGNIWCQYLNGTPRGNIWCQYLNGTPRGNIWCQYLNGTPRGNMWCQYLNGTPRGSIWCQYLSLILNSTPRDFCMFGISSFALYLISPQSTVRLSSWLFTFHDVQAPSLDHSTAINMVLDIWLWTTRNFLRLNDVKTNI